MNFGFLGIGGLIRNLHVSASILSCGGGGGGRQKNAAPSNKTGSTLTSRVFWRGSPRCGGADIHENGFPMID